jgi:hypothetical protein
MIIDSIIGHLLISLLEVCIAIPLIWVGEITMWAFSLGKRKPQWECYATDGGGEGAFLSEVSFWIGFLTLTTIGSVIHLLL